jgi:hypothetical protein
MATDGLWQHTCCEAFIATGPADHDEYREFNFSPSSEWASYRFAGYRQRDTEFTPQLGPLITLQHDAGGFALSANLAPEQLPTGQELHVGLAVVIETIDDRKSYWALTHGAAQPDFHLRQSFSLVLKAVCP